MAMHEIVLPETKPETEWVRGRPLQKVSATYDHARLESLLSRALGEWADARETGRVGTEWRFRVAPPGEAVRPLVADVSFLSYETLPRDADDAALQVPLGAPTVAVEILCADDCAIDVEHKIATYLRAGAAAVLVVDPKQQTIAVHGEDAAVLRAGDILTHEALPGFALDVRDLFERAKR